MQRSRWIFFEFNFGDEDVTDSFFLLSIAQPHWTAWPKNFSKKVSRLSRSNCWVVEIYSFDYVVFISFEKCLATIVELAEVDRCLALQELSLAFCSQRKE